MRIIAKEPLIYLPIALSPEAVEGAKRFLTLMMDPSTNSGRTELIRDALIQR